MAIDCPYFPLPAGVFEEENENSISELIFKIQENLPEKKEKRH